MDISRSRPCIFRNDGDDTIAVLVDHERFLVPPEGYLLTTGRGEVFLAFAGDAPMMAFPVEMVRSDATAAAWAADTLEKAEDGHPKDGGFDGLRRPAIERSSGGRMRVARCSMTKTS